MKIRASVGTLAILGVKRVKLNANPTTLCLMVNERCMYNCAYCPQAKNSRGSPGNLSRVVWPEIDWETLKITMLQKTTLYKRICFQVVNGSHFFANLMFFLKDIKKSFEEYKLSVPVSVSVRLQSIENSKRFLMRVLKGQCFLLMLQVNLTFQNSVVEISKSVLILYLMPLVNFREELQLTL